LLRSSASTFKTLLSFTHINVILIQYDFGIDHALFTYEKDYSINILRNSFCGTIQGYINYDKIAVFMLSILLNPCKLIRDVEVI